MCEDDQPCVGEELLPMNKQRRWFLEMTSTPGEDVASTVEMTTKDLELSHTLWIKQGLKQTPILEGKEAYGG